MSENPKAILFHLGENIKRIRESKNISQAELARRCDKDAQNIYKIEKGLLNITTLNLEKVAKGLDVSIKDLFDF